MVSIKQIFTEPNTDERSLEFLTKALEAANLPGFDYIEYKRAIHALQSSGLDEATAHKSAFTTAQTLGITKEKLLETAAFYRNLLQKEKEQFGAAMEKQNNTKIEGRRQQIKRLQDQIARHKADLERLQQEIDQYTQQQEIEEKNLVADEEKLAGAKVGFDKTLDAINLQLDRDVENIKKHL